MFILSAGAIVNVGINYFLIPVLGIEGAAFATLLGYVVSDIVCVLVLYKMSLMVLDMRFFIATVGMVVYFVVWRVFINSNYTVGTLAAILISVFFIYLYRGLLRTIWNKIENRIKK